MQEPGSTAGSWTLSPGTDDLLADVQRRAGPDPTRTGAGARASIAGVVAGFRWGAVILGMVDAVPRSTDGDLSVVATVAVVLFLTMWRALRPVELGTGTDRQRYVHVVDAALVGLALGWSGGLTSPFVSVLVVVATIAGFARGWRFGGLVLGAGVLALSVSGLVVDGQVDLGRPGVTALAVGVAGVLLASLAADRLAEAERSRQRLSGTVEVLSETNDMLQMLTRVARTVPAALDQRDAVAQIRAQLGRTFSPRRVSLLIPDETSEHWSPVVAEGVALPPVLPTEMLAEPLRRALTASRSVLADALGPDATGPGLYAALRARGHVVGLLAMERPTGGPFNERDQRTLDGLVELFGLSLDNARWFARLRLLGAEEERNRIARDLHDRLGQWLTYINLELERLLDTGAQPEPELRALRHDVERAIDELRESLRQLRSMVRVDHTFAYAARETLDAFERRNEIKTTLAVTRPDDRLPIPTENELLRILQEALHNIDKHARATQVWVTWDVSPHTARLVISDNGRGFDIPTGVRESAYGLAGMRERADAIAGRFDIHSTPGSGTTIQVTIPRRRTAASIPPADDATSPDNGVTT